jgi:hypothetical protein
MRGLVWLFGLAAAYSFAIGANVAALLALVMVGLVIYAARQQ